MRVCLRTATMSITHFYVGEEGTWRIKWHKPTDCLKVFLHFSWLFLHTLKLLLLFSFAFQKLVVVVNPEAQVTGGGGSSAFNWFHTFICMQTGIPKRKIYLHNNNY